MKLTEDKILMERSAYRCSYGAIGIMRQKLLFTGKKFFVQEDGLSIV